ncbi:MAG TPA: alpha-amylase family glycosyl hydrolase, partial [Pyrinomonadaceae bacterium]|nr:alpha-amylase family glycosyl hydrolase [Pyrinomonadaceae bacterium]
MPQSIWSSVVQDAIAQAQSSRTASVTVENDSIDIPVPFPSPEDWRDVLIYQVLVDRFNNPNAPPHRDWDREVGEFQGGTFNGIKEQLSYLQQMGVGAIWLSPVMKNCQYSDSSYHGYGIQDFLTIDPRLASAPDKAEEELQNLINESHARGMYVIFDIVLNHAGDVFEYQGHGSTAPWKNDPYLIRWRDEQGLGRPDWVEAPKNQHPDAAVWPTELCHNASFRRQGEGGEAGGDFASLKEMVTELEGFSYRDGHFHPVRNALIRAHQYLIAKFDVDGFRIDTLKYIERDFAQVFGNAMREFALSIGKKNFFTFGEVYDNEEKIAGYIGRFATESSDLVGVDAALDFPLFYVLPQVAKGLTAPSGVIRMFLHRKEVQRGLLSSHGEASRFFVTFLDNHDQHQRVRYSAPPDPHEFDD